MTIHDRRGIWVKVDGVTTPADAAAAAAAGVSAVGMVFASSPRRVEMDQALAIRDAIASGVAAFGIFGPDACDVVEVVSRIGLDGVQLPAATELDRAQLPAGTTVLRTVRVRDADDLADLAALDADAVHIDAYVEGSLGGTGVLAPWDVIEGHRPDVPFVVSGGLRVANVAECVRRLRPDGVDVSSGVESEPGIKDAGTMQAFVHAARSAGA